MMTPLEQLENKIRNAIPELREEFEIFQEGAIDFDMVTPVMLNHVLEYCSDCDFAVDSMDGEFIYMNNKEGVTYGKYPKWNLKSAYLKHQSEELINFLNELK